MPPFISLRQLPVISSIFPDTHLSLDDLNPKREVDVTLSSEPDSEGMTTHWTFTMPAYKSLSVSFKRSVLDKPDEKLILGLRRDPNVWLKKESLTDANGNKHGAEKDFSRNGLVNRERIFYRGTLITNKSFDDKGIENTPEI